MIIKGNGLNRLVAVGKLRIAPNAGIAPYARPKGTPDAEAARFELALSRVMKEQEELAAKAEEAAGGENAAIFLSRMEILKDEELLTPIRAHIRQGRSVVHATIDGFEKRMDDFRRLGDETIRERSLDILDVEHAMMDALLGKQPRARQLVLTEPVILAASTLTPSALLELDASLLKGVILESGSQLNHTAILLRGMNIPTITGCRLPSAAKDGMPVILDGEHGAVVFDPDEEALRQAEKRIREQELQEKRLQVLKGKESITLDGVRVRISANMELLEDVDAALRNDAEGIGLFRTEFLFLERAASPDEEEQFKAYKEVLTRMEDRPVTIRTCDIGADKLPAYPVTEPEPNPALGLRAVRFCLANPDFFKVQLRAILRASVYGKLRIMFPMITEVQEVLACREFLKDCEEELRMQGVPVGPYEVGITVETPAAALCAEELAREVDFFSIGTNDLLQYTCAADRTDERLSRFFDEPGEAFWKLVRMTIEAAKKENCRIGVCGEIAADTSYTRAFLEAGVDELSVNPGSVLPLRDRILKLKVR